MTDELPPDPSVAGRISPAPDGEGAPVFEVIGRREDHRLAPGHHIGDLPANIRPCDHTSGKVRYVLDEKWHTVTCSKCQQQIPAFAVLMLYDTWNKRHRSDKEAAERATRDLHVTRARYLAQLKGLTDAERTTLKTAIRDCWKLSPREMGAVVAKVEEAREQRAYERARKRDPVKGHLPSTKVIGGDHCGS